MTATQSFFHGLWHGILTFVVFAVPLAINMVPSKIGDLTISAVLILAYHAVEAYLGVSPTTPTLE